MEKTHVLKLIEELHQELSDTKKADKQIIDQLSTIKKDIDKLSPNNSKNNNGEGESSKEKTDIESSIDDFMLKIEVEHPQLTSFVNSISAALSKMGI